MRLSTTAGGLEENIRREYSSRTPSTKAYREPEFHLLEYRQRFLEYLEYYATAYNEVSGSYFKAKSSVPLAQFSRPDDENAYGDSTITHDLITEVYLEFSHKTRGPESTKYLRTLTGKSSMNNRKLLD